MKKLTMTSALVAALILSSASFAKADIANIGSCGGVAEKKAEKLFGHVETIYETYVDAISGNIADSGRLVYSVTTGNGEEGFSQYTIEIQQTLLADGSAQCRIVSAN